jgi:hypothetical protein
MKTSVRINATGEPQEPQAASVGCRVILKVSDYVTMAVDFSKPGAVSARLTDREALYNSALLVEKLNDRGTKDIIGIFPRERVIAYYVRE